MLINTKNCPYSCIGCTRSHPLGPVICYMPKLQKSIKSTLPECHPNVGFKPFIMVKQIEYRDRV